MPMGSWVGAPHATRGGRLALACVVQLALLPSDSPRRPRAARASRASVRPHVPRERGLRPVDAGVRVRGRATTCARSSSTSASIRAKLRCDGGNCNSRSRVRSRCARSRGSRHTCLRQTPTLRGGSQPCRRFRMARGSRRGARSSPCSPSSRLGTVARATCAQLQRKRSDAQSCSTRWRSSRLRLLRRWSRSGCAPVDVSRRGSRVGLRTASRSE